MKVNLFKNILLFTRAIKQKILSSMHLNYYHSYLERVTFIDSKLTVTAFAMWSVSSISFP